MWPFKLLHSSHVLSHKQITKLFNDTRGRHFAKWSVNKCVFTSSWSDFYSYIHNFQNTPAIIIFHSLMTRRYKKALFSVIPVLWKGFSATPVFLLLRVCLRCTLCHFWVHCIANDRACSSVSSTDRSQFRRHTITSLQRYLPHRVVFSFDLWTICGSLVW